MVKISRSWCHRSDLATEEVGTDSLQWWKADFKIREMLKTKECTPSQVEDVKVKQQQ